MRSEVNTELLGGPIDGLTLDVEPQGELSFHGFFANWFLDVDGKIYYRAQPTKIERELVYDLQGTIINPPMRQIYKWRNGRQGAKK